MTCSYPKSKSLEYHILCARSQWHGLPMKHHHNHWKCAPPCKYNPNGVCTPGTSTVAKQGQEKKTADSTKSWFVCQKSGNRWISYPNPSNKRPPSSVQTDPEESALGRCSVAEQWDDPDNTAAKEYCLDLMEHPTLCARSPYCMWKSVAPDPLQSALQGVKHATGGKNSGSLAILAGATVIVCIVFVLIVFVPTRKRTA
jgi:hypothetical protein